MGSLGDNNGETKSSMKTSSLVDHGNSETQSFDSQISTPPLYDEKVKFGDADELLQSTEPFDNPAMPDYPFETQVVNFADETQVIDFGCETQLMDFGGETQVFEDVNCIEHMETQLLDEFADEVVIDSSGEETDGTEVLCDNDELSDDESIRRDGGQSINENKIQCTSLCKHGEKGLMKQSDVLSNGQHNSGHHTPTATPAAQVSSVLEPGSGRMRFASLGVASLRASGLAARNKALKNASNGSCSMQTSCRSPKQVSIKDTAASLMQVEGKVNQDNDMGMNGVVKILKNDSKCRIGNPAVRKLFTEDSDTEDMELPGDTSEGENLNHLPACDLAGLSYIESQEPGELSQANALDFVDKFLKDNAMELDEEVDHRKSTSGNSKCVSSVKGPQRLAKKANDKTFIGEIGIYDWDDSREDEGGGEIFCRRKEEFFGSSSHRKGPRKPKTNELEKQKACKEKLNGNNKTMGVAYSDSRLVTRNLKVNDITFREAEKELKRNLVNEFNKESDINSSTRQVEINAINTDVPQMSDVGFDTQMAAEAMEALFCGVDVANPNASDTLQGIEKKSISSTKGSIGKKQKNIICSEQPTSLKRARLSDVEVASRKSKKTRGIGTNLKKESLVSSKEQFDDVRKQHETELVVTKSRKAKSKARQHLNGDRSENSSKMPCEIIEQREAGPLTRGCNALDKRGEIRDFAPIARRTRSKVVHLKRPSNATGHCREKMNDVAEVFPSEEKKNNTRGVQASKVLNVRSSKLGDTPPREVGNIKANQHQRLNRKMAALSAKVNALSCPRGGRSLRNLSNQVNESGNLDGPCKPSIQPEKVGQSITRHKRSCRNKRSSRSGCPVMSSVLNGKLPQQRPDMVSSEDNESVWPSTGMEKSPRQSKSSLSCETPRNSSIPAKDASPICMGNEYFNQSCERSLSRSYLLKEISSLGATLPEPAMPSKDLRRRREMTDVRVLYSQHLDDDIIKLQKKIVARLGVSIASSITDATHFIADEFVRTRNMLEAIASGKPVVTHLWLASCGQANCFIDEKNYILRDAKKEKEFGFSMPASLARASQHPLLEGWRVLVTPNTKPGKETISCLVKAVQGQAVERIGRNGLKDGKVPDNLLILSCEEDYAICVPFLEKGAAIYSSELLLNGIVTQKLEYERHQIFVDDVKRTRSTIWMKKDGKKFVPVTRTK